MASTLCLTLAGAETDHSIYLAHADGVGLIKVADFAYAPSISADGRCLAYISEDQVFLMDLIGVSTGCNNFSSSVIGRAPHWQRHTQFQAG